jgi:hypothetical protein
MTEQLLQGRYAPISSEMGFLKCDARAAADAFAAWQRPAQHSRGVELRIDEVRGDVSTRLDNLLPLTSVEARRYLFLPTHSSWTAFVDNGWSGTDVFSVVSFLALQIECVGVRAVSVPHTYRHGTKGPLGRYGATIFELYSPSPTDCSFLNIKRSIAAAHDGSRWQFNADGTVMDFERTESYHERQIRDRFTPELLAEYLRRLEIQMFSEAFFSVPVPGYLVSKQGTCAPGLREYTLEEVQASY